MENVILDHYEEIVEDNMRFMEHTKPQEIGEDFKEEYKEAVQELLKYNNKTGLRAYAYGHYTGNAVYKQDWKTAEKYLLKLLEDYQDTYAACSLGYIYYYGRTNNGVADYDKALKYFTIAEMAGITEAKYKICDMLISGNGVPAKLPQVAYLVLDGLYEDLEDEFRAGNISSEFPDVAIRLGNLDLETAKKYNNEAIYTAYRYYLIAKYALELRMKHDYHFGDDSVMKRLLVKYEEAKKLYEEVYEDGKEEEISALNFLKIVNDFVVDVNPRVEIKKLKNKKYRIRLTMDSYLGDDEYSIKSLVTVPELEFCKLIGRIDLVSDYKPEILGRKKNNFYVDAVEVEENEVNFCVYKENKYGEIEKVVMRLPKEGLGILKIV